LHGACQSFYEGIISAGADFASSPGRILIDFIDPLIVAEKIATTENYKIETNYEIAKEIKEGLKGISGLATRGKKRIIA
jgi:spore coat assembly protein